MLNGKELLDNNTHIIYEKITTDELPLKVIEVTLAKDDPNLIPPKHWHRSLEFIIPPIIALAIFPAPINPTFIMILLICSCSILC